MVKPTSETAVIHLPISALWEYSRNSASLEPKQTEHLETCDFCVSILGLSRICRSLPDLRNKLREHGIFDDAEDAH